MTRLRPCRTFPNGVTQLCPFQVRLSFYAAQKARLPESFRRKVHAYDCNLKISVSPTSSKQSARAGYFARGSAIFQIKPIGGQPRSRNQSTGAPFLNKDGSVLSYLGSTASSCACPWARWWKRTCAVLPTILNAGLRPGQPAARGQAGGGRAWSVVCRLILYAWFSCV
jgi:hypothetical protein